MNPILLSETESNGRPQICLLHMDEVAKRLGVSLQRAYELGRQGLLPIVRLGRQMRVEEHRLSGLQLRRPRPFGDCWLASEVWRQLGLTEFWQQHLPAGRESVSWEKVLRLLVVNRLLEPGSEFRVHRHWFVESAMDALLETDFAVAEKDRLYRCLDRIVPHKQELFVWLRQKWAELFQADFEVLLYDLTSTYFEGDMEESEKARRGYSRDSRPDCAQVVIALILTPDGFHWPTK